ncbi:MAG: AraC family transcriptional regulator [Paludibacteraceae bacterium]|nr:AraC family transcriptional regulator [Paludibacteraceae bacterium]
MNYQLLNQAFPKLHDRAGMILCTKGELVLTFDTTYLIKEGDLFCFNTILNPLVLSQKDFEFITIDANANFYYNQVLRYFDVSIVSKDLPAFFSTSISQKEKEMFILRKKKIDKCIEEAQKEKNIYKKKTIENLANLYSVEYILEILINHMDFSQSDKNNYNLLSGQHHIPIHFIHNINTHYTERNVEFYANCANLSISQFTRIIKEYFGKSPTDIISDVIINIAETFLTKNNMTIKEISSELNFPDQYAFQKYFKRHTGLTPTEFKKGI